MVSPLSPVFLKAYLSMILLGAIALSGVLAFLRGVAYLPAEASHAALGGVSIATLVTYVFGLETDPLLWAVAFSVASCLLVAYAGKHGGPERLNAALAGSLAVSVSIYAAVRAVVPAEMRVVMDTYLVSDILLISLKDLLQLTAVVAVVTAIFAVFYNELIYVCFDPEGAEALGLNIGLYDYLLFLLIGLAGATAAKSVGSLLVFALVLAPAATAREVAGSIKSFFAITFALTVALGYVGLALSAAANWPASGSIAVLTSSAYLLTLVVKSLAGRRMP